MACICRIIGMIADRTSSSIRHRLNTSSPDDLLAEIRQFRTAGDHRPPCEPLEPIASSFSFLQMASALSSPPPRRSR